MKQYKQKKGSDALTVASQIIGFAAVGLYLLSYQLKKRKQIVWVTCISNALYASQLPTHTKIPTDFSVGQIHL